MISSKENVHAKTPEDTARIFISQQFDVADYIFEKIFSSELYETLQVGGGDMKRFLNHV